eukprot:scaffold13712_cov124-Isochrysis_galbana.AAC.4
MSGMSSASLPSLSRYSAASRARCTLPRSAGGSPSHLSARWKAATACSDRSSRTPIIIRARPQRQCAFQ